MKRNQGFILVSLILIQLISLQEVVESTQEVVRCSISGTAGFNRDITITVEHNAFARNKDSLELDPNLWALQNPPISNILSGPEIDILLNGSNPLGAGLYAGPSANIIGYSYPQVTGGTDTIVIHNFHMPKTPTWFRDNKAATALNSATSAAVDCADFHSPNSNNPSIISSTLSLYIYYYIDRFYTVTPDTDLVNEEVSVTVQFAFNSEVPGTAYYEFEFKREDQLENFVDSVTFVIYIYILYIIYIYIES